jgi:EAL domain-containing protein (putative c-di-GMP-specific phosphodiesterase class I)
MDVAARTPVQDRAGPGAAHDRDAMRLFSTTRRPPDEHLLWSRDIRFVHRLTAVVAGARAIELDAGTVLIAPAAQLTEHVIEGVVGKDQHPEYGLVSVDTDLPESDRYLVATASAIQLSGIADRIGMAQSSHIVQTKMLDYFFSLRTLHHVAFQPIITLATGRLHEYECLFRPEMPMLQQSISSVVAAAIHTDRAVELDAFIIGEILKRAGRMEAVGRELGQEPRRFAINLAPTSLLHPTFEARALAAMVRDAGLTPSRITIECTEQESVADVGPLRRQVKSLRRLGFGFAVDDAGAGYASFSLVAAIRPSIIKIDREIVHGIAADDAKRALVEAFVSFGARIGARLVAEGIESRADLALLTALGVDFGQGFLLGRPSAEPAQPRIVGPARVRAARVPSRACRPKTSSVGS